jgi:hypothetical protein
VQSGRRSWLLLSAVARWTVVETEPLEPKDLTPAEIAALVYASRLLTEALDNNAE